MQSTETMNKFSYTPLDVTTPTIRVLRLHRTPGGSIAATLAHFPLDSSIRFRTLSYVWGIPSYTAQITLNSQPFPVLSALQPILSLIVDSPALAASWWWIDSICINQSGDAGAKLERDFQVQLMGRIYRKSESTLCWLGATCEDDEPEDTGRMAMEFLRLLLENKWRLDSPEQRAVVIELNNRAKWDALERLLLRPWWRRVWTLQEYILAPNLDLYCGQEKMSRSDFKIATSLIYLFRAIDNTVISMQAWQSVWNRRRLSMWYKANHRLPLLGLVAYGSDSKATDQRDRVYALLGLASDSELIGTPDYKRDIGMVYETFVKSFVETHQSLDILCFTHLFYYEARSPELGPALPSWVPDWQVQTEAFVIPVMASQSARSHVGNFRPVRKISLDKHAAVYAAAGETLPEADFSEESKLVCKGIFVDSVDGIGGLNVVQHDWAGDEESQVTKYQPQNSSSLFNTVCASLSKIHPAKATKLLDDISRCLVLDRQDRYLSYAVPPGHFYPNFKALCIAATQESKDISEGFLEWFELNRDLFIHGYSLQDLCLAVDTSSLSKRAKIDDMSSENAFLKRFNDTTRNMARRLITTNEGSIGMGPCRVQQGDRICILLGCSIPLILRQRPGTSSYEVIGECYLHGFMNGEVLRNLDGSKFKIENFELS